MTLSTWLLVKKNMDYFSKPDAYFNLYTTLARMAVMQRMAFSTTTCSWIVSVQNIFILQLIISPWYEWHLFFFFLSDFIRLFFLQAWFRCCQQLRSHSGVHRPGKSYFAFKHASSGLTFRGFLISSVNYLMSQTIELCNCTAVYFCLGWIVRFSNKPSCFVFFNCLRKSNVLLCHKQYACSSFHRKDTSNINT